ncbi:DUF4038 domain-containing protein [Kutzneria buriramensis]|uniref:Collagenase-like protein with putative collagen-binding domain n=1 Tax=Kutzneria buriramensis TaxID=1045776 RepID=A0A3E0GXY5_9PSEU|nr:DUF4038 domain-containing protein [Kutzneria buriramensis]REH30714.1 collagenase-like protein with putative collagen-binding domain [Kutzneria buriramensis]
MLRQYLAAAAAILMVGTVPTPAASGAAQSPNAPGPIFAWPTSPSANGRYLLDQFGRPYLISGDSPQGLFVTMSQDQAEDFFADRRANGFNALWINSLVPPDQGGHPNDATYDGITPFTTAGDMSTPNPAYWDRVERMVAAARNEGLTIWLMPVETCGHLQLLQDNGVDKAHAFGRFLGDRFAKYPNIVWFNGCDLQTWQDPTVRALTQAVASGLKETDPRHLQTVELNYLTSGSLDDPTWRQYIRLDAAYTYYPTYAQVLKEYNRANPLPVYMTEANYEDEHDYSGPKTLRRQEYWTMTSGATGQLYGSGWTWQFKPGWQDHVDTQGVREFKLMTDLFKSSPWYDLVPDQDHTFLTAGYGVASAVGNVNDNDYATAARTADGRFAFVYLPTSRTITVDMSKMRPGAVAFWYDPTDGRSRLADPPQGCGTVTLTPPGANHGGDDDWVLRIVSAG